MGLSELTESFERAPLAAFIAVLCLTCVALFIALVRSWNKRLEAAQVYGTDLAKMLELQIRTLEEHRRTRVLLEDPRILRFLETQAGGDRYGR